MMNATWDDAPHMTPEKRENQLSQYPAYQRDMRSKGVPLMGSGLIFEILEDDISCQPFEIPSFFFIIDGMDFGWDHPQAHIQLAIDMDQGIIYVTKAWKDSKKQPFEAWESVKIWAEDVPTAWPGDGLQTEKGSAKQQREYYTEADFNMLRDRATWPDGSDGVWAGIMELNNLMKTGRFKVFSSLRSVFEEIRNYHTKLDKQQNVKIVKIRDDLLDAIRYAYMMRRFAVRKCDIDMDYEEDDYLLETGRSAGTGY